MKNNPRAKVTIWTDADRVSQIEHVLRLMDQTIQPVGVGGPRIAQISELAQRLGCRHEDDLRKLLVDHPADFVLLGSMTDVGPEDLRTAVGQGSVILTLEPIASEFSEMIDAKSLVGTGGTRIHPTLSAVPGTNVQPVVHQIVWMPGFDRSPGWMAAADPDQAIGIPEMISIGSFGQPEACSLFARLYDAWQMVLSLSEVPEEIDASLTGPLGQPPENLRGITGHLAAHGRLGNGCATAISVSDRAGQLGRVLHAIGDQGHLHVSDTGYQLFDIDGNCVDRLTEPKQEVDFAKLIAWHWTDLIDRPIVTTSKAPWATDALILGCCQACLLSARTGHPESPRKLLQLHHC